MSPSFQDLKQLNPKQRALLARKLRAKKQQTAQAEGVVEAIPRRAVSGPVPASFAQRRLWFLEQLSPGHRAYHLGLAMRTQGTLDQGALEKSLAALVERHEALRTTFRPVDGEPVQVVAENLPVNLPRELWESAKGEGGEGREGVARECVQNAFAQPFDLEEGPLWRARLLQFDEEDHLFVLVLHHIITDGWSQGVLRRELSALYEAFRRGAASPLAELPIQYPDFAQWQHQKLQGEAFARQLQAWRDALQDLPSLELPLDRPRPKLPSGLGRRFVLDSSAETSKEIEAFSRQQGATPFMVLLAAFAALLGRACGQVDFAVGSPVANRQRAELEKVLGFFVNMLVLRLDVAGELPFEELVQRTREVALQAFGDQSIPYEKLVEELAPERELGKSPLFQAAFAVQNMESAPLSLSGLQVEPATGKGDVSSRFDLELFAWQETADWRFAWIGAADLFDRSTVERFGRQYETVLRAAMGNPRTRLFELPLLGAAEQHQLVVEWNDTEAEFGEQSIHGLVESQARRTPGAVAVQGGEERLSYGELWARVRDLAEALRGIGVGDEVVVGLSARRTPEMVVAVFAILKAGGAYLPLDPSLPEERLVWMAEDAEIGALVTESSLVEQMSAVSELVVEQGGQRLLLDEPWPGARQPSATESASATGGELAYVIYTSGSTGRPKGVGVSHGNVVNLLHSLGTHSLGKGWKAIPGRAMLAITTLSFDIAAVDLFLPLMQGARLVVAPEGLGADGERLAKLLEASDATLMQATPGTWRLLLAAGWRGGENLRMISTGEALPSSLGLELLASGGELWNFYGPTETTVWSTGWQVKAGELSIGRMSIGSSLANTSAYVLDDHFQAAAVGGFGELALGGQGVSRGYLRRPGLTAERFVPDPFGFPGGRLYRTGDRVRRDGLGRLVFQGRLDHQVKVRGHRIELGEIESVLEEHPHVSAAAVLVQEEGDGDHRLVAFWVPAKETHGGGAAAGSMLRSYLLKRLPQYMVPAIFEPLETLPVLPNGKTDRKALMHRQLTVSREGLEGDDASESPLQKLVAEFYASILGRTGVRAGDSFFALGGHSLLATRLVSRLREKSGVELPLRQVFESPTVAGLAAELAKSLGETADAVTLEEVIPEATVSEELAAGSVIEPIERGGLLAPSFAQERLWFLDKLEPGNSLLNMPAALRLRGRLALRALRRAVTEVVRRHESLRTVFEEVAGQPMQRIEAAEEVAVPRIDLSDLLPERRTAVLEGHQRRHAKTPFDLKNGPLLRVQLHRLAADDHVLLLNVHHIVSDGWSMGLLFRELFALYEAFAAGRPSPLPELTVQYVDFAAWQRRQLRGEQLATQLAYWRDQLADPMPVLELPFDRPRGSFQSYRGALIVHQLERDLSQQIIDLGQANGATLFMTLLATFKVLLARLSGQSEVVVGAPIAGRNRGESEPLIGFFLNTLVLRTELGVESSFEEVLRRVREVTLGAYSHQEVPFEKLLAELKPERDLSRTPLFQVFFNMLEFPAEKEPTPGLKIEMLSLGEPPAKFDLTIYAARRAQGIALRFAYNADLFDAERMQGMVEQYVSLLTQVIAHPTRRIDRLSLAVGKSRDVLPDPADLLGEEFHGAVHELFADQAQKFPDRPAVIDRYGTLTYGELATLVRVLAGILRRGGVGRGDPVVIHAYRSAALPWAILGVLEAGGAFVILEPAHPPERLIATLEQSAAKYWIEIPGNHPPEEVRRAVEESFGESKIRLPERPQWGRWVEQHGGAPQRSPSWKAEANDLACIGFTSGSTGVPKGICGCHGALTHFLPWQKKTFSIDPKDCFSMISGVAHDPLQRDLFTPLILGASVSVPDPEQMFRPGWLANWLARERITVAHLTPAHGQFLAETPQEESKKQWPSLRFAFFIGDVLYRRDVARLECLAPALTCVNLYGSTETQRALSYHVVKKEEQEGRPPSEVLPLGRGMEDVQLLVLGRSGGLAGVGELGELCIRSPHLSRGYLCDPASTARCFTPTPGGGLSGERLYRTGDLGRYLPHGEVVFVGRADQQVKVRGFRIELGEIETVLKEHPEVAQAVAGVHQVSDGNSILVAWVVPIVGAEPTVGSLRELVGRKLPTFMVPAACVMLKSIPRMASGKIDRMALARRAGDLLAAAEPVGRSRAQKGLVASRNRYELHLLSLFEQVLRKNPIGVEDSFFELGGHSLLATRLFALIEKSFEKTLPISTLFRAPTVAQLAKVLRDEGHSTIWSSVVPIHPWGDRPPLFCVHGITGDPFIYRHLAQYLEPDQPLYGLRAQGLDGESEPFGRVEDMAAHYLEEIRRLRPHGPYFLGGFCFGGTVASEIARQFLLRGEEVGLLAIFDTQANISNALSTGVRRRYALSNHIRQVKGYLEKTKRLPPHRRLAALSVRGGKILWRVLSRVWKGKQSVQPIHGKAQKDDHEVTLANRRASRGYTPDYYPGTVTLFRSTESIGQIFLDPRLGWQVLAAGGLEILDVPGLHHAMFDKPHVKVLAKRLQGRLDAAVVESHGPLRAP